MRTTGAVTVAEVEELFGVSPMTARRDLAELERRGVARRTHGGAVLPTISAHEDSFARRLDVDADETKALQAEWDRRDIPVPLKALDSPFREITRPIVDYVKSIRSGNPRDLVVVYIPEYVLGHWWEQVLHNQSALRLRARLQFQPGVMITTVPWQLESSIGRDAAEDRLRLGQTDDADTSPYG